MSTSPVPIWPIITLRWEGEVLVVGDSSGSLETRHVLPKPDEDPFETSRRAAVKACKSLRMERARVEGIDGNDILSLIVDTRTETLISVQTSETANPAVRTIKSLDELKNSASASRFSRVVTPFVGLYWFFYKKVTMRKRKASVWSWFTSKETRRARVVAFSLVCVLAVAGTFAGQRAGWFGSPGHSVEQAAPAPAGQLPIYAPGGWQTYASWTVPITRSSVPPVLSASGKQVVVADGSQLKALNATTGAVEWTSAVEGSISTLQVMAVDGATRIVISDGTRLRVFSDNGTPVGVFDSGAATNRPVTDIGKEPFFTLADQRALVISKGALALRRVPAGAAVVGVDRGSLFALDAATASLWKISTDDVKFPHPTTLPTPRDGGKLVKAYTDSTGALITVWESKKDSSKNVLAGVALDGAEPVVSYQLVVSAQSVGASTLVTDRAAAMSLVGSVLIDSRNQKAVETPSSGGKLGAGYWWGSKDQQPVRMDVAGTVVPSPAEAPVPLFSLPHHRVLVEAGTDQSIYALAAEGEK